MLGFLVSQGSISGVPFSLARLARAWRPALLLAVVYVAIFVGAMIRPIPNETGQGVSPQRAYSALDHRFYTRSVEYYKRLFGELVLGDPSGSAKRYLVESTFGPGPDNSAPRFPSAPLFPFMLWAFDYSEGNALPLATFYLILGVGLSSFWIERLKASGLSTLWLTGFALLPVPVWFTLNVSTDLPFALAVALFYYGFFRAQGDQKWLMTVIALVVAVLLRPNAISLLAFLVLFLAIGRGCIPLRLRAGGMLVLGAAIVLLLWFYTGYIDLFLRSSAGIGYFGLTQKEFLAGIVPYVSGIPDQILSFVLLIGAKLVYLVGARPSYGETSIVVILVRAAPALILLPGLIRILLKSPLAERLFVLAVIGPSLLGVAQERYALGIFPLLYANGVLLWQGVPCLRWSKGKEVPR